jgi:hypothetical protein
MLTGAAAGAEGEPGTLGGRLAIMRTLGAELPREISRCIDVLKTYQDLPGGAGVFGAILIRADIDEALRAQAEGDVVAMLRAYKKLTEVE